MGELAHRTGHQQYPTQNGILQINQRAQTVNQLCAGLREGNPDIAFRGRAVQKQP